MLRILYMGTPDFSVAPLKKLLEYKDKYEIVGVATNCDKPVGRKQILTPSPVSLVAEEEVTTMKGLEGDLGDGELGLESSIW